MTTSPPLLNVDPDPNDFTSLEPDPSTPTLSFLDALDWAQKHDATFRFNANREHDGDSFRVTVYAADVGLRFVAVHPIGPDLRRTMAQAIAEAKKAWEASETTLG